MINRISSSELDQITCEKILAAAESIKDDFYDYSKVVVRKPWGYEYLLYENDSVAVWILYLKEGAQTSMHCHPNKKTSLIVMEGEVICSNLNGDTPRSTGQGLVIEKGVFHQTSCKSPGGAFVMEVETPVNKRDLLRLKDKYGRENLGYEKSDSYSGNTQNYNYLSLIDSDFNCKQKKRFRNCTLTLRRVEKTSNLSELFDLNDDDLVCVLRGKILDVDQSEVLLDPADTLPISELRSKKNLLINHPVELLLIRKMDHITKVSDYIVNYLKQSNFFFVPGDANVHFLDSLGRAEGAQFTSFFTEKAASFAAEGYSKTSGHPSVMIVSSGGSGPASIPGVANAWVDSTPMIVLSGQARSDQALDKELRQLGNKSLNIIDLVKPITKYAAKITEPTTIRYHLEKASYLATEGRPGPVWLDIPIDIQGSIVDESELEGFNPSTNASNRSSSRLEEDVHQALELLKKAKRPVLLLGHGARGAKNELVKLIEKLGIPVLLTRRGCDLLAESHPLFFGRPGAYGQRRANFIIQNSDLIISIGARLSIPLVGRNHKGFARNAKKIVIDIDPKELKKGTVTIDLPIESNAVDFVSLFHKTFITQNLKLELFQWIDRCKKWISDFPALKEYKSHSGPADPYLFISILSQLIPDKSIIVMDGGAVTNFMMQTFEFKSDQKMVLSTGLELPGFALAGALGASIAKGRAPVICLCEDIGIQAALCELQTVINEQAPIKFFVFRSQGSLAIRNIQKDFFGSRYVGTDTESTVRKLAPLAKIVEASECKVFDIRRGTDIKYTIQSALDSPGVTFCEVHVDPHQELIPRPGFVIKEDGKWLAKPIEDMYPFLNTEDLKANMLVDLIAED